jgi:hypothetical protein
MKFEIKHRITKEIIFSLECESFKLCVEMAIKTKVSLRCADLSHANLSSADLSHANLRYADLRYTDLSHANLSSADLSHADLRHADLSYADLIVFQFQKHWAYYTLDGSLRIGCIVMPVSEWALGFNEIGKEEGYSDEQILIYGQFINICLAHFKRNNK